MEVPVSLWEDFYIIVKRKGGLKVTMSNILVTMVKDYLDGLEQSNWLDHF